MYICVDCNYTTLKKTNYERHLISIKHNTIIEQIKNQKKYKCDECDYETKLKENLTKHKKLKQTNVDKLHVCELCNYKTLIKTMFDKHIKSDKHKNLIEKSKIESIVEKVMDKININQTSVASRQLNENIMEKVISCIQTLSQQNTEIIKHIGNTNHSHNTNTNTNTNSHNTYNVVQILDYYNKNMKDAMTIEKFNELIKPIQTGEFLKIGETKKTYKKILCDMYETKLNKIPKKERPLACYDPPNHCFIVNKDGEGWIIDGSNNELKKSIFETHKGVLESGYNTMNDEAIMKKYDTKIMQILMKSNVPKEEIEKITHEILKLISHKGDYETLENSVE